MVDIGGVAQPSCGEGIELRYEGDVSKHKYRLDFTILNSHSQRFVGFELNPQSTHIKVEGKNKTLNQHNAELSKMEQRGTESARVL